MVNNWVASICCMTLVLPVCLCCLSLFIFFPWFATDLYPEYAKYTTFAEKNCLVTGYYTETTTDCELLATAADYPVDTQFDCKSTYLPYLNTTFGVGLIRKSEKKGESDFSDPQKAINWQSTHNLGERTTCFYEDESDAMFTELEPADIFIILETIFAGVLALTLCGCAVVVCIMGFGICALYTFKDYRKIQQRVSSLGRLGKETVGLDSAAYPN